MIAKDETEWSSIDKAYVYFCLHGMARLLIDLAKHDQGAHCLWHALQSKGFDIFERFFGMKLQWECVTGEKFPIDITGTKVPLAEVPEEQVN